MNQNSRLLIINLTCFISFLLFWITFVTTVIYRHCWSYIEFWFDTQYPVTPFTLFISLFAIITLWLISELWITFREKLFSLVNVTQYIICSTFLVLMTFVFINFYTAYQIENGKATPYDLLFNSESFIKILKSPQIDFELVTPDGKKSPDIPRWRDYLYAQTCSKGIDITALKKKQYQELRTQYLKHVNELYEKAGVEQPD